MPIVLLALAALAAQTVVAAASTDAWAEAKRGFARLLGRGDKDRAGLAERRLDDTRKQLADASGKEKDQARARLEAAWQARLADFLEENPDVAGDLQAFVDEIRAKLPAVAAAGHSVAAGGNISITATGGGVAAGTIDGNVTLNPTQPGPAKA